MVEYGHGGTVEVGRNVYGQIAEQTGQAFRALDLALSCNALAWLPLHA
jgi:hypothetical protein